MLSIVVASERQLYFREHVLAASLKPPTAAQTHPWRFPFPRARARGLIEALHDFVRAVAPPGFPRARARGLIEAANRDGLHRDATQFPRARARGLIEAGTAAGR